MRKTSIIIFVLLIFAPPVFTLGQECRCLSASKKDVPSVGNMVVIINEGKVKQVKGTVTYMDGELMEDAVIEVFKISRNEISRSAYIL